MFGDDLENNYDETNPFVDQGPENLQKPEIVETIKRKFEEIIEESSLSKLPYLKKEVQIYLDNFIKAELADYETHDDDCDTDFDLIDQLLEDPTNEELIQKIRDKIKHMHLIEGEEKRFRAKVLMWALYVISSSLIALGILSATSILPLFLAVTLPLVLITSVSLPVALFIVLVLTSVLAPMAIAGVSLVVGLILIPWADSKAQDLHAISARGQNMKNLTDLVETGIIYSPTGNFGLFRPMDEKEFRNNNPKWDYLEVTPSRM